MQTLGLLSNNINANNYIIYIIISQCKYKIAVKRSIFTSIIGNIFINNINIKVMHICTNVKKLDAPICIYVAHFEIDSKLVIVG